MDDESGRCIFLLFFVLHFHIPLKFSLICFSVSQLAIFHCNSTVFLPMFYGSIFYNSSIDELLGKSRIWIRCFPGKGKTMRTPRAGTGCRRQIFSIFVHTAVLKGAADFFCSTHFSLSFSAPPLYYHFFKISASALRRVRFFIVGKKLFLAFYRCRAPPSGLEISIFKNFRIGGKQIENQI